MTSINRLFSVAALLAAAAGITPGQAQRGAVAAPPARADSSWQSARADTRALATADSLRNAVLRLATYAGFADTSCAPGDVRTFERDSTGQSVRMLKQLEMIVLSYGVSAPLENAGARSLFRAVLRLEGGGPGPRWDTMTGTGPRAFNPILPVLLFNPESKECVMTPGIEPDGILLPDIHEVAIPRDSGSFSYSVSYGAAGLNDLRNFFFSHHQGDKGAVLHYTRVNAYAIWGDYAVVNVVRQQELNGVVSVAKESTGAEYIFHHAAGEWRLLALVRNW